MSIKIENTGVMGWEAAIRGMRNPMNSWEKSDTIMKSTILKVEEIASGVTVYNQEYCTPYPVIGPNDMRLAMQLRNAGPEHAKFLRMIAVTCDITAPLYWWKEFDTYKVGTVANSCSTMHKIADKEFTLDDFSHEHLDDIWKYEPDIQNMAPVIGFETHTDRIINYLLGPDDILNLTIKMLNRCRNLYNDTKDKKYWWQMIQLLPSSYNQKRTVFLNYWVLANIYHQRQHHKQDEWRITFCDWIKSLPYSNLITGDESK